MIIQDLKGKLTNDIIKRGEENLFKSNLCIGALFLMKTLEEYGFVYSCVYWHNNYGYVSIFNKLYEVSAFYGGKPFEMMRAETSFLNKIYPKKITLKFEYIE